LSESPNPGRTLVEQRWARLVRCPDCGAMRQLRALKAHRIRAHGWKRNRRKHDRTQG